MCLYILKIQGAEYSMWPLGRATVAYVLQYLSSSEERVRLQSQTKCIFEKGVVTHLTGLSYTDLCENS